MSRRRGLGSGLDALIPSSPLPTPEAVRRIPTAAIRENRSQPRTRFDEQALEELSASIREHGLIQPIIVTEDGTGGYELIAGERRLRAARRAGLSEIPALIKSATPQQLLELALVENVQRADLNPLEEGLAYQTLKDEFGLTDEAIAQRVGKSRVAVVNTRRLIKLVPEARQALLDGTISAGHGRALLRFEQEAEQHAALQLIARRDMSVREAERLGELGQHAQLAAPTRQALLHGTVGLPQAQAISRIEDPEQQGEALRYVLEQGLGVRDTEQLCDLLENGASIGAALAQITGQTRTAPQSEAPTRLGASPAVENSALRAASPEDAEARRVLEEALATPVQIVRSGATIRVTITVYGDEQLQGLFDRLTS